MSLHGSEGGDLTLGAHLQFVTDPITAAAGAGAGSGAPVPVVKSGSNDCGGTVTFGTGSGESAGVMVAVTFSTPWTIPPHANTFPHAVANPDNVATQGLGIYVSAISLTGFSLSCAVKPHAGQANTVYSFSYLVLGLASALERLCITLIQSWYASDPRPYR